MLFSHIRRAVSDAGTQDLIAELPDAQDSSFIPIVLGSDKTTVSVATGQNEYYPVYLSIGNVCNSVRRAHRDAVTLVAFLACPKSKYLFIDDQHMEH